MLQSYKKEMKYGAKETLIVKGWFYKLPPHIVIKFL